MSSLPFFEGSPMTMGEEEAQEGKGEKMSVQISGLRRSRGMRKKGSKSKPRG